MAEPQTNPPTVDPPTGGAPGGTPPAPPAAPLPTPAIDPPTIDPPKVDPPKVDPPPTDDFKMDRATFNDRITQAKGSAQKEADKKHSAFLQQHYGTSDPTEVQKIIETRKAAESAATKRKRDEMSELDRAKADVEKERKRAEKAERELGETRSAHLYEKQDHVIARLAASHVSDKYVGLARRTFATHLKDNVTAEQAAKMTEKDITNFFKKEFLKEFPETARAAGAPPPPAPPKKKVITNGLDPNAPKPPPNKTDTTAKTAKPGQQNSMSKGELRQHLKSKGLAGW